jgi:predicted enzyme related to lactoylglutathione lyase
VVFILSKLSSKLGSHISYTYPSVIINPYPANSLGAYMFHEIGLINYPVTHMAAAKKWYSAMLGVEPYIDTPQYVGFRSGSYNIGLNPNGYAQDMEGPVVFWEVADIHASFVQAKSAGATVSQEPQRLSPQVLGSLVDPDGILLGSVQYIETGDK